jgi:hypothetical protein
MFVENNDKCCNKCEEIGHLENKCNSKNNTISSIKFGSCYLLPKGANVVHDRFINTPFVGTKKNHIWVPKN